MIPGGSPAPVAVAQLLDVRRHARDMDDALRKEMREYAWKYFDRHAQQRLLTFHFFVILSTAISAGILTLAKAAQSFHYAWPLAFLLCFLSFIFWKLDLRTKQLIKHSEQALMLLERECGLEDAGAEPHRLKLFTHEEWATKSRPRWEEASPWMAHFSYSDCFNAVFGIFGFGGFILGLVLMFL